VSELIARLCRHDVVSAVARLAFAVGVMALLIVCSVGLPGSFK